VLLDILQEAGATRLGELPGIGSAGMHGRARRHARRDPLVERLADAMRHDERLHVTYHAAAGVAPLDLCIAPQRLVGGARILALDIDSGETVWLELDRIGRVRRA
jgi:hypothetical protein